MWNIFNHHIVILFQFFSPLEYIAILSSMSNFMCSNIRWQFHTSRCTCRAVSTVQADDQLCSGIIPVWINSCRSNTPFIKQSKIWRYTNDNWSVRIVLSVSSVCFEWTSTIEPLRNAPRRFPTRIYISQSGQSNPRTMEVSESASLLSNETEEVKPESPGCKLERWIPFYPSFWSYHFGTDMLIASWCFVAGSGIWVIIELQVIITESGVHRFFVAFNHYCTLACTILFFLGSIYFVYLSYPEELQKMHYTITHEDASKLSFTQRYFTGRFWDKTYCTELSIYNHLLFCFIHIARNKSCHCSLTVPNHCVSVWLVEYI